MIDTSQKHKAHWWKDEEGTWWYQFWSTRRSRSERARGIERVCKECGGIFLIRPHELKIRPALFCSNACKGKSKAAISGNRYVDTRGYVSVYLSKDSPYASIRRNAGKYPYVYEHRLVMSKYLNRPVQAHERVHHINGDRADNRIENLQLMTMGHGAGVALKCCDCGSQNIRSVQIA